MSTNNKWGTAQLAVVNAVDADVFDSMSLGMSVFPSGYQPAPDCLCDGDPTCFGALPMGVACGAPTLPTVAISAAGTLKSSASTGVRHSIYDYLTGHSPETSDPSDSSPIYDSLVGGYAAIQALGSVDKRLLVLITDGGFSCTSVSTRSGISDGMCPDWEYPDAVNALITKARTDASKPVETFIVGVPGSDSTGEMQGPYATAPYHMRLALSTYAVSGSPDTVDPTCDKTATFSQTGADPAHPCHIDLSSGTAFNPTALAGAIKKIRGQSLGCVYDLPDPGAGQTVDKDQVNVLATIDGTQALVPKRKDSSDDCSTAPCWDYDANGKVAILGKECADLSAATMAKVDIYVGCDTIIK